MRQQKQRSKRQRAEGGAVVAPLAHRAAAPYHQYELEVQASAFRSIGRLQQAQMQLFELKAENKARISILDARISTLEAENRAKDCRIAQQDAEVARCENEYARLRAESAWLQSECIKLLP